MRVTWCDPDLPAGTTAHRCSAPGKDDSSALSRGGPLQQYCYLRLQQRIHGCRSKKHAEAARRKLRGAQNVQACIDRKAHRRASGKPDRFGHHGCCYPADPEPVNMLHPSSLAPPGKNVALTHRSLRTHWFPFRHATGMLSYSVTNSLPCSCPACGPHPVGQKPAPGG